VRHVRMLGLCLVAVLAVAVVAASSASAAGPEWGQCYAKAKGKYADSNCQTKASKGSGEFEWRKGVDVARTHFTGAGGAGVLNVLARYCEGTRGIGSERNKACEEKGWGESPIAIECVSENNTGKASGKDGVTNVSVRFHQCALFGSIPCSNTPNEGEVLVNPLKGTLGYINKGAKEVGVNLTPEKKKGDFVQFSCGGGLGTVVGEAGKAGPHEGGPVYLPKGGGDGIISPITPVNQMSGAFTQVFTTTEDAENIPNKFEGKPLQVLESYTYNAEEPENSQLWSKAGEIITNVNTPEEEVEIKA
jgi:hypothetical protein